MTSSGRVGRWAKRRILRKVGKSIPFVGAAVSVALLYDAVKRKGAVGGVADTVLSSVPFFGALKNGIELLTDDWIPDRPPATSSPSSAAPPRRSTPARRTRGG